MSSPIPVPLPWTLAQWKTLNAKEALASLPFRQFCSDWINLADAEGQVSRHLFELKKRVLRPGANEITLELLTKFSEASAEIIAEMTAANHGVIPAHEAFAAFLALHIQSTDAIGRLRPHERAQAEKTANTPLDFAQAFALRAVGDHFGHPLPAE